jgi:hypothetical protein
VGGGRRGPAPTSGDEFGGVAPIAGTWCQHFGDTSKRRSISTNGSNVLRHILATCGLFR